MRQYYRKNENIWMATISSNWMHRPKWTERSHWTRRKTKQHPKISSTSAFCLHFKRFYPPHTHLHTLTPLEGRHLNIIHSPYYARSAIFLRKKNVNKYIIVGILMRLPMAFFHVFPFFFDRFLFGALKLSCQFSVSFFRYRLCVSIWRKKLTKLFLFLSSLSYAQ